MAEPIDPYYAQLALHYQNAALLSGYPGCALVEGKEDIDFWEKMFSLHDYHPDFLPVTQSKRAAGASGLMHCLKFRDQACPTFLICIDSDYRYPAGDTRFDGEKYLLQTHAHSIENHYAHFDRFNSVCREACGLDNTLFDFRTFLEMYAEKLYPLFLWQIEHVRQRLPGYQTAEFLKCINESYEGIPRLDIDRFAAGILHKLEEEVKRQTKALTAAYPDRHPEAHTPRLAELGITPRHTFLFVRGHNLRRLVEAVGNAVVGDLLKKEKEKLGDDKERIRALYRRRKFFDDVFVIPPLVPAYPELMKVWEAIRQAVGSL